MNHAFTLRIVHGIGRLIFDLPGEKVNKFTGEVVEELEKLIDSLKNNTEIKILVIESAKKNIFIAGADIKEIVAIKKQSIAEKLAKRGQDVFNKLEDLPFPTVAVIDGACLGGGTEFSLACTFRVATDNDKVAIGLPEVNLGILPGWGGTQRLPKLIGLTKSLSIILTGKPFDGRKAYALKVVDALIPQEFKEEKLAQFLETIANDSEREKIFKRRKLKGLLEIALEKNPLGRAFLFYKAKKDVWKKTKGVYPAPLKIVELLQESFASPLHEGLKKERDFFSHLAITDISKNLIQLFFIGEALKKDAGEKEKIEPKPIYSAGVLGAGIMGGGIGWAFSNAHIPIRMKDIALEPLRKAYATTAGIYQKAGEHKPVPKNEIRIKMHKLSSTLDYTGFRQHDIVIEAIIEDMEIKKQAFRELENNVRENTIIASNTSTLSIHEMSSVLKNPDRFIGMHFFNPVNRMPLVEIIPGKNTSGQTIATTIALARRLKKTPLVVKDSPGFLVNRILIPYMIEATLMAQEGIDIERIDAIMEGFGMPMGPFILADEIGLDVCYKVCRILAGRLNLDTHHIELLKLMIEKQKLLGKKSGAGFYIHNSKEKYFNKDVVKLVHEVQESYNISPLQIRDKDILDRMVFRLINESGQCLEEAIIERPYYLDMALVMGTGFPPFRGGILRYVDSLGIESVMHTFHYLQERYGERFKPCMLLEDMKRNNRKFYEEAQ